MPDTDFAVFGHHERDLTDLLRTFGMRRDGSPIHPERELDDEQDT